VLQCVAVCCSVLQCVAVWCSELQCVAVFCVAWCCRRRLSNTLHHTATHCVWVQHTATNCNSKPSQHTATHCNTLSHIVRETSHDIRDSSHIVRDSSHHIRVTSHIVRETLHDICKATAITPPSRFLKGPIGCSQLQVIFSKRTTNYRALLQKTVSIPQGGTRGGSCMSAAVFCVAACCSVLQHVAACCSMMQRVAACCSVLQHVAACCSMSVCCSYGESWAI